MVKKARAGTPDFLSPNRLREARRQADLYKAHLKDQLMFLLFRDQPQDSYAVVAALGELIAETGASLLDVDVTVRLLRHVADRLEGMQQNNSGSA